VLKRKPPLLILLGHRHHQAQVGLDHAVAGAAAVMQRLLQLGHAQAAALGPGLMVLAQPLAQLRHRAAQMLGPLLHCWPMAQLRGQPLAIVFQGDQIRQLGRRGRQALALAQQAFPALHLAGQGELLLVAEQVNAADVLQV